MKPLNIGKKAFASSLKSETFEGKKSTVCQTPGPEPQYTTLTEWVSETHIRYLIKLHLRPVWYCT